MPKLYFHELTDEQLQAMQNMTWEQVQERYQQPAWCTYVGALDGDIGCWSLVGLLVKGEEYCKTCDCYGEVAANA